MGILILGVVALILCILGFFGIPGVAFAGFVLGIIAWVLGKKAYKADPSDKRAKAGKNLGIAVVIIGIISIVVSILFIVGITTALMAL